MANYDAGLENRALAHIVSHWDSIPQRIRDLKKGRNLKKGRKKADKTGKALATVANEILAAQNKRYSERNVALKDEDIAEYLMTGKTKHTRDKKYRMIEAGKKPILTSKEEINAFISSIISGNAAGEVRAFATVGTRLANAVKAERESIDLTGNYLELNADYLREAYKRHIMPKENGDIPLTEEDFRRIPEYLDEFDGVLSIDTYKGCVEIQLYKVTVDGYIRILTVTSNERKSLQVTKILGNSREKFEAKYAKKIERDAGSPRGQNGTLSASNPSTKARYTESALSEIRIPQSETEVKYQDRVKDAGSDRAILVDALKDLAWTDVDLERLEEYRKKIRSLNEAEKRLQELNGQIRKLTGKVKDGSATAEDREQLRILRSSATRMTNRIDLYDSQLLRMEALQ